MYAVIVTAIFVLLMGFQIWNAIEEYKIGLHSKLSMGTRWSAMVVTVLMFIYYVRTYLL